ncbi:ATP-binding protein [Desulfobacterales bacterium HSG17]|nr:ATP-binding protein [Desulfobacterales bacterium HSG17]
MSHKIFNTIAFKLTLWFTGIFTICSGVVFVLFYFLATQTIETQIDESLLENASKFSASIQRNGLMGARELAVLEAQAAGEKVIFFRLLYSSGEVFASSHMSYWKDVNIQEHALKKLIITHKNFFETIAIPSTKKKARILYSFVAVNVILQTGIAMDYQTKFLSAFKKVFFAAMGFIIVFSAVSGWLLVAKALSGVKTITKTAQNITGSNLEARVRTTGNKNELDQLVITFNSMLDRIEKLVKNIREMSDNIAHDLKSPITRIRGFAELALVHDENMDNYRTMAANTIEESDRLLDMINTMLLISRAEAGESDFQFKTTNLSSMVKNACDLFAPLAEDKNIELILDIQDNIFVIADIQMLQRAFSNLLDNAIKYTYENGQVCINTAVKNCEIIINVEDTGPGVDSAFFEKIFERFYRTEESRSSAGTGLGLSLARTIVRQHKGNISVFKRQNQGIGFKIILPYYNLEVI